MNPISLLSLKNVKPVFKLYRACGALIVTLLYLCNGTYAEEKAQRILPLSPALAEWTAELVGLDPIVGITEYTDYPVGIEKKPVIGPYHRINFEIAMKLKPSLILASLDGNSKDQIELFRSKKIPIVLVGSSSLEEIVAGMRKVAVALKQVKRGDEKLKALEDRIAKLEVVYGPKSSTSSILVQVGTDPLIVVGRKTYLNDILTRMRQYNVVEDPQSTYPRLSIESVLSQDPRTILVLAMKNDPVINERMRTSWSKYYKMQAVKNRRVIPIMNDELMRPGLRLVQGIDALEKALAENPSSTGKP